MERIKILNLHLVHLPVKIGPRIQCVQKRIVAESGRLSCPRETVSCNVIVEVATDTRDIWHDWNLDTFSGIKINFFDSFAHIKYT